MFKVTQGIKKSDFARESLLRMRQDEQRLPVQDVVQHGDEALGRLEQYGSPRTADFSHQVREVSRQQTDPMVKVALLRETLRIFQHGMPPTVGLALAALGSQFNRFCVDPDLAHRHGQRPPSEAQRRAVAHDLLGRIGKAEGPIAAEVLNFADGCAAGLKGPASEKLDSLVFERVEDGFKGSANRSIAELALHADDTINIQALHHLRDHGSRAPIFDAWNDPRAQRDMLRDARRQD